jgi:hypothetical protein
MSIVFRGLEWRDIDGIRTCVRGDLLSADLVSIPSNSGARVLGSRSFPHPLLTRARQVAAEPEHALARVEIARAKAILAKSDPRPIRS